MTVNSDPEHLPLSSTDERNWSMLAHFSILVNLVTGFLGPVIALGIYLLYGKRSKVVAYHAMQSFLFQLIIWYGLGILWGITGLLSLVLVGILLIPFSLLLTPFLLVGMAIAPVVGIYAGIQASRGQPFSYWLIDRFVPREF